MICHPPPRRANDGGARNRVRLIGSPAASGGLALSPAASARCSVDLCGGVSLSVLHRSPRCYIEFMLLLQRRASSLLHRLQCNSPRSSFPVELPTPVSAAYTWPILLPPPASNVPCLRHRWETGILAGDGDDARTRGCHVACRDRPWAGDDSGHGPGGVRRGPSRTPVMPPLQRQSGALPLSTGNPLSLCPMPVCHI